MAKRFATDVGFQVCDQALQLHGGYGYIKDTRWSGISVMYGCTRFWKGTNEIMRLIIGRRLLDEAANDIL